MIVYIFFIIFGSIDYSCLVDINFLNLLSGKPSFTKKQADLFFPPDFADDFPVAMQV